VPERNEPGTAFWFPNIAPAGQARRWGSPEFGGILCLVRLASAESFHQPGRARWGLTLESRLQAVPQSRLKPGLQRLRQGKNIILFSSEQNRCFAHLKDRDLVRAGVRWRAVGSR
jgi:hypothetical protein